MTNGIQLCYHLRGEHGVTAKIKEAMQQAAKQFVYIGFLLWEVKQYDYYYEEGYDNVYQYAEYELGFKRSSTKNFIAICETFCKKDVNYKSIPTMFLDERWSEYQYSQLTEMLAMSPTQREKTKSSMTIKQIRELKKPKIVEADTVKIEQKKKPEMTGQTSGHEYRWIKINKIKNPEIGNFPMKLLAYRYWMENKPKVGYCLAFYKDGEWITDRGAKMPEPLYYTELPPMPCKK